jgi:RNA polymerase sigma-70 factor (ECF subfamily)
MSVRTAHALRTDLGQFQGLDRSRERALEFESSIPIGSAADSAESPLPCQWHADFAEAVAPHFDRLHRLARRILRSDDLAEDAVQEALTSLWREERLPPNTAGWLCRAVVNRSLHLNRSRRRRRSHEERACLHRSEFHLDADASHALEVEELGHRIEAAISDLPERFREVFVLREVEHMDYGAIADALRVPVGTVRSRLSRSREALQKALCECRWPGHEVDSLRPARIGAAATISKT